MGERRKMGSIYSIAFLTKNAKIDHFLLIFGSKMRLWVSISIGQRRKSWFSINLRFFVKIDEKSSKKRSKSGFLGQNSLFPGGYPGFCEKRKFRWARDVAKSPKLPKVYGIWGHFQDFWSFSGFWGQNHGFGVKKWVFGAKFRLVTVRKSHSNL